MRNGLVVVVVGLLGCSKAGPSAADETPPVSPTQPHASVDPRPEPVAPPVAEPVADPVPDAKTSPIAVQMTAATLADDCSGPPRGRPPARKRAKAKRSQVKGDQPKSKSKRRCDPSSIQLSVVAPKDAKSADITVKSVELLLESGTSVGTLQTRSPSVWSDEDGYTAWNEKIEPAQDLSVSYSLTPPDWSTVEDRWNQSYTVKAVVSIAGADQTLEHSVVVATPTSLPPNVKT